MSDSINPSRCLNVWGSEGECGHTKATHGPRGDCQFPGCLCATYTSSKHINPLPGSNTRLQKWVDPAMFGSETLDATQGPKVYLLAMNTDPLGSIAACAKMYKGEVVRDLSDVTDEERRHYLAEMQKTKLAMPLESVQFHFMIEGVTRSFTHQLVRQRTAAYAQESLRFAVVEDGFSERVALPPSLAGTEQFDKYEVGHPELERPISPHEYADFGRMTKDQQNRIRWDYALSVTQEMYSAMVNDGMPAEDARGLLPHNITTRVNYITNLRGLLDHAGNRLCTQAQFEWRLVFARIADAIRTYDPRRANARRLNEEDTSWWTPDMLPDRWQFEAIAALLKPVCYQTGRCAFEADFDRKCKIRNRVQANADINRPSSAWDAEYEAVDENPVVTGVGPQSVLRDENRIPVFIGAIRPAEWLLDPGAAR